MEILNFNVVRFCVFDFPILIMLEVLYFFKWLLIFQDNEAVLKMNFIMKHTVSN